MKEVIRKFTLRTIECDWNVHTVSLILEVEDSERNEWYSIKGQLKLDLDEEAIIPIEVEINIWDTVSHEYTIASWTYQEALYKEPGKEITGIEARFKIEEELYNRLPWLFSMYFPYGSTCHC